MKAKRLIYSIIILLYF